MGRSGATLSRPARRVGRRRRRLRATIAILAGAILVGGAVGFLLYRAGRARVYLPGEAHAEITSRLDLGIPEEAPRPRLEDVTRAAGLAGFRSFSGARTSQLPEDMGPGAAWGDFDNDGDDDLLAVSLGGPLGAPREELARTRLYENRGDGTFAEATGFPETRVRGMAASWGDYDGDGWRDLALVGHDTLLLFHNEEGRLVRDPALPDLPGFWAGASWADFDLDGDLDLYVCGYVRYAVTGEERERTTQQYGQAVPYTLNPAAFEPERNLLFRNAGRGRFDEVAGELGVAGTGGRSLGALWHDFDENGWPDLYVANDISDNVLYLNHGGTFEDVSHAAWVADYRGAMGLASADWDRDGDDDLFVSHWIAQENALYDSLLHGGPVAEGADEGAGASELRFVDVADQRGLGQIALQAVGWGAEFVDLDGDGWLDLVVANGSTFETAVGAGKVLVPQASFLFWNRRGESFHDLAPLVPALSSPRVSRGLAVSDYDADGDVDLLIVDRDGGLRLLRNEMQSGNWLELRLRRKGGAGVVEGALVVARLGDAVLRRTVGGASYLSQSSSTIHLGVGGASRVASLEVRWPGGDRDVWENLGVNALWELTEGGGPPRSIAGPRGAPRPAGAADAGSARERVVEFWRHQRAGMHAMKVEGDCAAAIPEFRRALELRPDHGDSRYYLGNCLAETGDVEGGLRQFAEMARLDPMSHRAHKRWGTLRALTARDDADLEAAQRSLERAVEINPEATGAMLVLGEVALIRDDPEAARQRLEWVARSNPRAGEALFLLAHLASTRGDAALRDDYLARALAARGEDREPRGAAAAEGDVRRIMHTDATPLGRFYEAWDGSLDPTATFAPLEAHLDSSRR